MRRIKRTELPEATQKALDRRQNSADAKRQAGILNVETEWKSVRKTKPLKSVHAALKLMAGRRERCMYCGDSHGTDIEHFWPKSQHPDRMFRWPNMLLCCVECGRLKGIQFPLANNSPILLDPTVDDPWKHLDFDPATGNIVARFDTASNDWSNRGQKTVEALQLDRREALSAGHQKTHRRLVALVEEALQQVVTDTQAFIASLRETDEHGLLGWCFTGTGRDVTPFNRLRQQHPAIWNACEQTLEQGR